MNKRTARLLEKHFDTAFAAPDGIAKLRELILTLAMQGKLVEQNPKDQPASELLKEIQSEKQRLVKASKIKKPKPLAPVKPEEVPYELPEGWEWVRLGEIGVINPRNEAEDTINVGFVPMPLIPEGYAESHRFEERPWKEIKKGYTHFANGDIGMAKITPCFENAKSCVFSGLPNGIGAGTTELHIFRNAFNSVAPRFLLYYLKNPHYISAAVPNMTGSAGQKRVPTPYFIGQLFPLPPKEEQHRIVAKIDQLMARCDELEKLHTEQQQKRLAVHTAAIRQLLDTENHQKAWQFLNQHFGDLYTVKENVTELRKAVLQLAVMGKLVPQNPNDPPASELLREIEAEKQRLVKAGKIKKPKPLPAVKPEEVPYELPQGWEWVRLGSTISYMDAGWSPKCESEPARNNEWGVLKTTAVQTLQFLPHENKALPAKLTPRPDAQVEDNDILITRAGPKNRVGICCVARPVRSQLMLSDKIIRFKIYGDLIFPDYCALSLNTGYGSEQIERMKSGMADSQMNISQGKLKQVIVATPPLPEQHRIVARIDQLMALCDTLEQQIDATTAKQSKLLTALLNTRPQQHADIIDLSTYRSAIGCYVVGKLANTQYFGRTAAAKVMYLAQAHVGLTLDFHPEREAAGPLDKWIYEFERQGQRQGWFEANEKTLASGRKKTEYRCLSALSEPAAKAEALMSVEQLAEFDRLIYALADKKTEEVEIIATLFAVWNDFLIDGIQPTDEQIITDVRENWHERKARFLPSDLKPWLSWLRRENLIPRGLPPRTVQQQRLGI